MYDAIDDPYCYPGTSVLINKLDIRELHQLQAFEAEITRERASEPLPAGRISINQFRAVHRHLFQDVYSWAGKYRTVRISKEGSMFCYPQNIGGQLQRLFDGLRERQYLRGRSRDTFSAGAAHFLAELNAIHAFQDGSGRAQLAFMALLGINAGYPLDFEQLNPDKFLAAMLSSFQGDESSLVYQIESLLE
jgi:cell filamentation protein